MAQICSHCSRPNPGEAAYCYFDGNLLQGRGAAVNAATQPFPTPFVFPSGQQCLNFDQLALGFQRGWSEAIGLLQQGFLEKFLGGMGRADLAMAARAAAAFPDRDRGLDQLLAKLPTQALAEPKLKVEPSAVNLGTLQAGAAHRFELELDNQGARLLYGAVVSDCEWLTIGEAPGNAQKLFQCVDAVKVAVNVRGDHLRAGAKAMEGRVIVESNGGSVTVLVRVEVPVKPFPEGVLAGAATPRDIAVKAKQLPKEAAVLFEKGAVAQWYKDNGWTYPVRGQSASGLAAIQQFFEALGLVKPPKVEVSARQLALRGRGGERLEQTFQVFTQDKRPVYAHAVSDQDWLTVNATQANSTTVKVTVIATMPPRPNETFQAQITVMANGNQRFVIPVAVAVGPGNASSAVPEDAPVIVFAAAPAMALPAAGQARRQTAEPVQAVMVAPLAAVVAAPTVARRDTHAESVTAVRRSPLPVAVVQERERTAGPLPGIVHAFPAGLLGLVLLMLLIKDILGPRLPAPLPPPRAEVKIDQQDPDKGDPTPAVAEAEIDPTPRVYYAYDFRGRFGVSVRQTRKRITYSPVGGTNSTVLKIGDVAYEFGGAQGNWLHRDQAPPIDQDVKEPGKAKTKNVWLERANKIQVTQALDVVPSKQPVELAPGVSKRLLETCLVAYLIENKGTTPQSVGLRLQLDTLIGNNDGVPFAVPGMGLVNTSADFRAGDRLFPDFLQALEVPNLENPGTVAHLTVKVGGGLEPPDRVSLTHWPGEFLGWDVPIVDMLQDSAVVLYWSPKLLQPNEKRAVGFAYGLGTVSSDAAEGKGKLALTLSGSFEPGEVFTATAYVSGAGPGQTLKLNLPAGLQRVEGDEVQPVPPAVEGGNSLVSWKVRVERPGQFPLTVQSSNGLSQRRLITITRADPGKRPTNPDNIFR